jgi:hypothetical protein
LARVLSTAFLVALLAATAAAFALTEGAKLELSPIYRTQVSKDFSPACNCATSEAFIDFRLRKADHLSVWLERDGKRVVTLVPGRTYRRGEVALAFDGISSTGITLPDGAYKPVVHLGRSHRTIRLPNEIQLDTRPPAIKVRHRIYTHISPDGDGRHDVFRVDYAVDGPAHGILLVGLRRVEVTYRERRSGVLVWNGKFGGRPARPGNYVLSASAMDPAGNAAKPFPFAVVNVRYVELGRTRILARPRARFAVRVLTDASTVSWRLHGGHGEVAYHTLHLRAPKSPGVYRLYVEAAGHAAKALVVVA